MTATQMAKLYAANNEARRQQAMMDAVYTPELKEAMTSYAKTAMPAFKISEQMRNQLAEIVASQAKVEFSKIEIPHSLLEHVQEQFRQQNETIAKVIKLHGWLPAAAFKLPDGWSENVALWREQLEAEGALGDLGEEEGVAERLRRIADERQHVVTSIARCGAVFETCRLLGIPIPPVLCALVLIAYVLADVASEMLDERDDLD